MKEIKMTVEATKYVAFDGKEFDDAQACRNYEVNEYNKAREVAFMKIMAIPHVELSAYDYVAGAGCDEALYVLKVKTEDDLATIKELLKVYEDKSDTSYLDASFKKANRVNESVKVLISEYDGDIWYMGTLEEYLANKATELIRAASKVDVIEDDFTVLDYVARVATYGDAPRYIKALIKRDGHFYSYYVQLNAEDFPKTNYIGIQTVTNFLKDAIKHRGSYNAFASVEAAHETYNKM